MYSFYYPETNTLVHGNDSDFIFNTADEAIEWFDNAKANWSIIDCKGNDLAAFMNPWTGDIIVVREMTDNS